MSKFRAIWAACAVAFVVVAGAQEQPAPTMTTIEGSPLVINVGSDGSFQVYNNAFPGQGQVYPTSATLADMGVFAVINDVLHAPDFSAHGGSATGSLGTYTPWTPQSISAVSGAGLRDAPYTVTVNLSGGDTGVTVTLTVEYVNGQNFFRLNTQVQSTRQPAPDVDIILGADIYLAGSDRGIFTQVPELSAVGGRNCNEEEGIYNILLIPLTPAHSFTTAAYSEVWSQIAANELRVSPSTECIDNGAALKWASVLQGGSGAVIESAVSFGDIPDASNFVQVPFTISVDPQDVIIRNGQSVEVEIQTHHNPDAGFDAPIELSTSELPPGVTVVFDETVIPAPGSGTTHATLTVGPDVFPRTYTIAFRGTANGETRGAGFTFEVPCTPPIILGIHQPKSASVPRGETTTLSVVSQGEGTHRYQWYEGLPGMVRSPVEGATSATLTTPPVTSVRPYWVRVQSPCGSVNSIAAWTFPRN